METSGTEKLPFSRIDQVGVVVRDVEKAIEYYSSIGIGPFEYAQGMIADRRLYGKPAADIKNVIALTQLGHVQLELIQPAGGESIHKEFLETKGEGIHHLGFLVDDLEKETAKLTEKGFKITQSGTFVGGGGFAYFDTDKVGGVLLELIQRVSD